MLAGTSSEELEDFAGAEFCGLHVFADCNKCIWIREKTLECSSVVLSTLCLYVIRPQKKSSKNAVVSLQQGWQK